MSTVRLERLLALGLSVASAAAIALLAAPVQAQDGEPPKEEPKAETKTDASVNLSPKGKPLRSTTEADSDHALLVGAFAIGYLGASEIPFVEPSSVRINQVSNGIFTREASGTTVSAPVIGMRYWISDLLGLDVGLGFITKSGTITRHWADGSDPNAPNEQDIAEDKVNQLGFLLHAGVPLALHAEKHWVFQIIPEFNVGFSSGKIQDPRKFAYYPPTATPPMFNNEIKLSGLRFDFGTRVGTELHFGFIGVPNLSLQASVGLYLRYDKFQAKGGGNPDPAASSPDTSYSDSTLTIGTAVYNAPWDIFTKNVAALYYF